MVSFLSLSFRLCVRLTSDFSTCFFFVLADFFPGHSQAVPLAIEADREARRANGEVLAANAPLTVDEQLLSIEARLRPAHWRMRRL